MERTTTEPEDYLASLPEATRADMEKLDALIGKIFAERSRVMWEGNFWGGSRQQIIGYGDLAYQRPSATVDWFMVGLAAQKSYLSLYVNAIEDGDYAAKKYAPRLGKVKVGSASISFKSVDDLDLSVLTELLQLARSQLAA